MTISIIELADNEYLLRREKSDITEPVDRLIAILNLLDSANLLLIELSKGTSELLLQPTKNIGGDLTKSKTFSELKRMFPSTIIRNIVEADGGSNIDCISITDPYDLLTFRLKY